MTVIELWNMWVDWQSGTVVHLFWSGDDPIGRFDRFEDVLNQYGTKKVHCFGTTFGELHICLESED